MAHTFVIQSVTHIGDTATVTGTVDGVPVTVQCWFSALTSLPSANAVQTFLAGLMLAAMPAAPVAVPTWNGTIVV